MVIFCVSVFVSCTVMPRKCCAPGCKGNYTNGPNVSVFFFPKEESLKMKWINAIHGENFVPSKQSVVSVFAAQLLFLK